jgi:DNA-binding NarL/FixJ family response regulator
MRNVTAIFLHLFMAFKNAPRLPGVSLLFSLLTNNSMGFTTVPMPSPQIKLLVVMKQLLFREALASLLTGEPDLRVAAQVSCIEDAVHICATTCVECALVEFDTRHIELTTFCASLRKLAAFSRILLMGDILRFRELEVLQPLPGGVLPNSSNSGILVESIRRIAAGQTWQV